MRYYVIEKIELINNSVVYTETKFTDSESLQSDFNTLHYADFETSGLTLEEYLQANGTFYKCTLSTSGLIGRENLSELTDINTLE